MIIKININTIRFKLLKVFKLWTALKMQILLIDFNFDMCQFFFIISSNSFTTNFWLCCYSYTSKDTLYNLWHPKIHWNVGGGGLQQRRNSYMSKDTLNTFLVSQHPQKCFGFCNRSISKLCNLHCVLRVLWPWPYELICVVSVCFNNHITDTQAYQSKMTKFGHISELMFVFTRRVSYSGLKTQSLFWRSWIPARVTTVGTVVCLFVCLVFI